MYTYWIEYEFIGERFGIAVPDDVWVEWRHLSDATEYI